MENNNVNDYDRWSSGYPIDWALMGRKIRNLRKRRQLTQRQLAEKTGLAYSTISHIETAQIHTTIDALLRISDALLATPNDILEGNYNKTNSRRLAGDDEYYNDLGKMLADAAREYEHKHKK